MYTVDSSLIGYKDFSILKMSKYFSDFSNKKYYYGDFLIIFTSYKNYCKEVNIDPFLAIAQMAHETDYSRSWWCQRPRRNPAGIRVTGESKYVLLPSDNPLEWQYNSSTLKYHRGLAFSSWSEGIKTQLGHLLCYIYKDNEMNETQLEYSNYSPNKATLNAIGYRGVAKKIDGLNKRWAIGPYYALGIVKVANTLKKIDNS